MAIVTHHTLLLRELRFTAPARVQVWQGRAILRSGGVTLELGEGESFSVPPFVRFSCLAHPCLGMPLPFPSHPAVWSLSLQTQASADMERAADTSKPWARMLANEIFAAPNGDWRAACIAQRWHMTPARLRACLFAEGEALSTLVREQRVAFVLARLACMDQTGIDAAADFMSAGFTSAAAMAAACENSIGLAPEIVQHATSLFGARLASREYRKIQRRPRYRAYF
jgi:hypothetical protein